MTTKKRGGLRTSPRGESKPKEATIAATCQILRDVARHEKAKEADKPLRDLLQRLRGLLLRINESWNRSPLLTSACVDMKLSARTRWFESTIARLPMELEFLLRAHEEFYFSASVSGGDRGRPSNYSRDSAIGALWSAGLTVEQIKTKVKEHMGIALSTKAIQRILVRYPDVPLLPI